MKNIILCFFLLVVGLTCFVGCSDGGDMSSPPATNAPASPKK